MLRSPSVRRSLAAWPTALFLGLASLFGAATPIGSLAPSGEVLLGKAKTRVGVSQPVLGGEWIETGAGLASIRTWTQGALEVRENSRARLFQDRLDLERGSAASTQLPIRLHDLTVEPQGAGEHWFAVGQRGGQTLVAAHKGQVVIRRSGARSVIVPAGSFAFPSPKTDGSDDSQPSTSDRSAQPTASTKGGWTIGKLTHGQSMLVVGGVAAVATTGVVAGVVAANDQPSRSASQ